MGGSMEPPKKTTFPRESYLYRRKVILIITKNKNCHLSTMQYSKFAAVDLRCWNQWHLINNPTTMHIFTNDIMVVRAQIGTWIVKWWRHRRPPRFFFFFFFFFFVCWRWWFLFVFRISMTVCSTFLNQHSVQDWENSSFYFIHLTSFSKINPHDFKCNSMGNGIVEGVLRS